MLQEGAGPLELELQGLVNDLTWLLGTKLVPSKGIYVLYISTSLPLDLAVLELAMWTKLALNSWKSTCPCLLNADIKGVCSHA